MTSDKRILASLVHAAIVMRELSKEVGHNITITARPNGYGDVCIDEIGEDGYRVLSYNLLPDSKDIYFTHTLGSNVVDHVKFVDIKDINISKLFGGEHD